MMGAGNVKAVFGLWSHVPDPALRVLTYMALITRDEDAPPSYWAGPEPLALCMGRQAPHGRADHAAVERALAKLVEVGAITRERHPAPGRRAAYALNLSIGTPHAAREATPQDTPRPARDEHPTPGVTTPHARRDNTPRPAWSTPHAPRGAEEEQEDQGLTQDHTPRHPARRKPGPRRRCSSGMLIAADGSCCDDHDTSRQAS